MNDRQSKIIYPVRKSGRRRTMKITEVEDKENSPTKKALRSPERDASRVSLAPNSPIKAIRQPEFKQLQETDLKAPSIQTTITTPKVENQQILSQPPINHNLPNYIDTKQALHTSLPDWLIGREEESRVVVDFVQSHMEAKRGGSLYMSGAPGTGKTAVLHKTLNTLPSDIRKVYINCMSHKNSHSIYSSIHSSLHLSVPTRRKTMAKKTSTSTPRKVACSKAISDINKCIVNSAKPIILVLDEIDSLDSKNQEVLYTIFEWPSTSNLILIGISNSLDLTDRILPRLKSSLKLKPSLINFPPYSEADITTIVLDRLAKLGDRAAINRPAIMYCARKVSSMAGDVRVALDICRRAVEVVEVKMKRMVVEGAGKEGGSMLGDEACKSLFIPSNTKVNIPIMMSVINEVYGQKIVSTSSSFSSSSSSSSLLPLQQLLLLCTLLLTSKRVSSKEVLIGKLHESYTQVCKRNSSTPITISSFIDICSNLHDRGIITVKKHKEVRMAKVTLRVNEGELQTMAEDTTLLSAILSRGL